MFNKETEYAIRSLVYIAQQNKKTLNPGVVQIATAIDAPQSFTAKVLQRMGKKGLLSSKKGKGGGFFLDAKQEQRNLKELIALLEGDDFLFSCGMGLRTCSFETPCPLHENFVKIREAMEKMFAGLTVQGLALKNNTYLKLEL